MSTERRARIAIATAANLRDLGGWPTSDGARVRPGLVYRSAELSRLHGEDLAAFADLGIRKVFDLRTAAETAREALSAEEDAPDALGAVAGARRALESVREHDPEVAALADRVAEVSYLLADVAADVAS